MMHIWSSLVVVASCTSSVAGRDGFLLAGAWRVGLMITLKRRYVGSSVVSIAAIVAN